MKMITAAICSCGRYDLLRDSLQSLLNQASVSAYQILVVINAPDLGAAGAELLDEFNEIENLQFFCEPVPGLSHARNAALRLCSSEYLAFLDDDAVADAQWLSQLLSAFEVFGSRVHVVGGKVAPIWEVEPPPWLTPQMLWSLSLVDWGEEARHIGRDEWLVGTNIAFRTEELRRIGGFPVWLGRKPNVLLGNEEIAVIRELNEAGYPAVYQPSAVVHHRIAPDRLTLGWFRRRAAWQAVSDVLMDSDRPRQPSSAATAPMSDEDRRARNEWIVEALFRKDFNEDRDMVNAQLSAIYMLLKDVLSS